MSNQGLPSYTIHRPAAYDFPTLDAAALNVLISPPPDWIYFGTLQQLSPEANRLLRTVLDSAPKARRCYDINLRRDSYTPALVRMLLSSANVLKLNEDEVGEVAALMPHQSTKRSRTVLSRRGAGLRPGSRLRNPRRGWLCSSAWERIRHCGCSQSHRRRHHWRRRRLLCRSPSRHRPQLACSTNRAIRVWCRRSGRQPGRRIATLASLRDRLSAVIPRNPVQFLVGKLSCPTNAPSFSSMWTTRC